MSTLELQTECFKPVGTADLDLFTGFGCAYPTLRTLQNTDDEAFAEEWAEDGAYDGKLARLIFLFQAADLVNAAGEPLEPREYPWEQRLARIILLDVEEQDLVELRV